MTHCHTKWSHDPLNASEKGIEPNLFSVVIQQNNTYSINKHY